MLIDKGGDMLRNAKFINFTTVPNEKWNFSNNLNIIIGENGTGKSHVLKGLYSLLSVQYSATGIFSKNALEKSYAEKMIGVLQPENLGRLVKRKQGRARCEIELEFNDKSIVKIGFASNAKSLVEVVNPPEKILYKPPVYFPTRELVTLCPWFTSLVDNYHLEFDGTWGDTVSLLGAPSVKGPRETKVASLLIPLEEALGGRVVVDSKTGRFYLNIPNEGNMEMPLVAEGLRKLVMLARLISTGVLLEQGFLFWDEPEANLNPKLIRGLAKTIIALAQSGIQIFLATHSLFLLREIEMQLSQSNENYSFCKYFALAYTDDGVALEQSNNLEEIDTLVVLDEEIRQAERFLNEGKD